MTKEKDKFLNEYEKMQHEIIRDKVKKAVSENPGNYREALEEIGFTWFDDDHPSEEEEENSATPENDRQKLLVSFFEGRVELSAVILEALQDERNAEEPNYPLIRKYFRAANPHLKALILFGLKNNPTQLDFLNDLVFSNEFDQNLQELIECFTNACRVTEDLQQFSEIAREFYYSTLQDGYNALYALRDMFDDGSDKLKIIDFMISEEFRDDQDDILF